jgi:hypothetical protein
MTAPLHQLGRPGTTHDSHWLYIQGYIQGYLELLPHCSQGRTRQDNSSAAHPDRRAIRAIRQVPSTWTDMPLFSPFLPLARDIPSSHDPSAIQLIARFPGSFLCAVASGKHTPWQGKVENALAVRRVVSPAPPYVKGLPATSAAVTAGGAAARGARAT